MSRSNPSTVVMTGASGFIGRHLIEALVEDYTVHALARRTQSEAGVAPHPNLHWILADITDRESLEEAFRGILDRGSVEYVVHLAAYYDFGDQQMNERYRRTNVEGTGHVLELSRLCRPRRFVFASSVAASEFPAPGRVIDETSPLDAGFPYALTKKEGEALVEAASRHFPCTVVRFAAIFSDWCEYEPLYCLLRRWLAGGWGARIVPGRGEMAIPYLHVGCVTRLYFGEERRPLPLPASLAAGGVLARDLLGRMHGRRPFERRWMTRYIDRRLPTDCSRTRALMQWAPARRHLLPRRMLHLVENLKSRPDEWHRRNLARVTRFADDRPSLALARAMHRHRDRLVDEVHRHLTAPETALRFPFYRSLEPERLRWYIERLYANLLASVRHGDRTVLGAFGRDLARVRHSEGVQSEELVAAMRLSRTVITRGLVGLPELEAHARLVDDSVGLAIQLAVDEIEDTYELLDDRPRRRGPGEPSATARGASSR